MLSIFESGTLAFADTVRNRLISSTLKQPWDIPNFGLCRGRHCLYCPISIDYFTDSLGPFPALKTWFEFLKISQQTYFRL